MYQPAIPLSGIGGWKFLQATYSRQLESFSDTAQIRGDIDYMKTKLSEPMSVESFLDDRRLLRITLTANDLAGEEWKRGFIDKVLDEARDPESNFLDRLNNAQYTRFAETFAPIDGKVSVSPQTVETLAQQYEAAAFRVAVGEVDNNMRLSLNYQSAIVDIAGTAASDEAVLYRILGNVPVRTVLESALNLPSDMRNLPVERQADMLKDRLASSFGIRDLTNLASLEKIDQVLERFHAMEAIRQGPSPTAPGAAALALLNSAVGFGSGASQNLFLGRLLL